MNVLFKHAYFSINLLLIFSDQNCLWFASHSSIPKGFCKMICTADNKLYLSTQGNITLFRRQPRLIACMIDVAVSYQSNINMSIPPASCQVFFFKSLKKSPKPQTYKDNILHRLLVSHHTTSGQRRRLVG